jgi:hypothetical protein
VFNQYRRQQFKRYNEAKDYFVKNPQLLINLEQFFADYLRDLITTNWRAIARDYNEASYLFPFWQNYPPQERGRQPKGDQYPWIEVGEHAVGAKLPLLLSKDFAVRDPGIPTGADLRFVVSSKAIAAATKNFTDSAWLTIEIKSVGPRDDEPHAVMSHNQVSGDGVWTEPRVGLKNSVMHAVGRRRKHEFHCSIPPFYVLSDMTVVPFVNFVVKPVYRMLSLSKGSDGGQPLGRIAIVCIPNGILLATNPNYLKQFPKILFPGKDDAGVAPKKKRARVDFELLSKIAKWRVRELELGLGK